MVRQGKTAGKLARRSILTQKKRYFAILLIVLLSVGFLSGLKVTKEQMWDAAGRYLAAANMYDYRIYSTLGFSEDDIKELGKVSGIYNAEGEKTADVIFDFAGTGKDYQVLSLPERINIPSLYGGRLPEKDTECLADHRAFSESDIGKTITVSADNDADTRDLLANEKYTIVGLVNSPLFLSSDRGSASGGTGERGGYLYLPADNFTSMAHIGSQQYDGVQTYQLECTIDTDQMSLADIVKAVREEKGVTKVLPSFSKALDVSSKEAAMSSVSLYAFENDADLSDFWNLSDASDGEKLSLPKDGSVLVSRRLSEKLGLSEGTKFTISEGDQTLQAGPAFVNYIGNFILTSQKTAEALFGEASPNTLLVCTKNLSAEQEGSLAEKLGKLNGVSGITRLSESRIKVDRSVACLNYIIWLIIAFAGALSFIVIFNLTNINLEERSREIATVEVLGFTPGEVRFYVLRENLVLSFFSGLLGIPLGILCTHAVMKRILLDTMTFHIVVRPLSCVLSLLITVLFAAIVNVLMRRQIRRIHMAESLKAVE